MSAVAFCVVTSEVLTIWREVNAVVHLLRCSVLQGNATRCSVVQCVAKRVDITKKGECRRAPVAVQGVAV